MADIYKVKVASLNSYSKHSTSGSKINEYKKGAEVKVYTKEPGDNNKQWGNIKEKGNEWLLMESLEKTGTDDGTTETVTNFGNTKENTDKAKDDTTYGNSDSAYNKVMLKYIRALGSPPRFTKNVDPWYSVSNTVGTGRAMAQTWLSDPAILSICPGSVDYLPGFGFKTKKNQLFNQIKGSMSGDLLKAAKKDKKLDANGQLYAFKSAYTEYMNVVNLMARMAADFMGIGDVTDIISGSKLKLKNFDYGYYSNPSKASSGGIFSETLNALNTAVSDGAYVHFFVNHSGANVSETISTDSGKSWLEEQISSGSGIDSAARNIQFLFGSAITDEAKSDIEKVIQEANTANSLLGGFATIANNYLKGGRLVFPKMITGMDYNKSAVVELSFTSVYGDRRSIFKYVILPCIHLLAMATPKQLSSNMYTYPFLCRIFQRGNVNMDLAYISSLDFSRGGSENTSWTVDGLPTEVVARFTVTPLYTNMMVTSAKNPFLAMQNTALMEYLGTMVGLDLKSNVLSRKVEIAKNLLSNKVHDIPTNAARGITDTKLINEIRKFTSIVN